MAFNKTNSFCFRFLSHVSGIDPKTIDIMIDNGFDSIHSLVALKVDTDLTQIQDILLGQKAILREALQDLQKKYKQMRFDSNKDITFTRLLEECLNEDKSPSVVPSINPLDLLSPSVVPSVNPLDLLSPISKHSTPKPLPEEKEVEKVIKTSVRRLTNKKEPSATFAEKLGLRSATKRASKEEQRDSFQNLEPEVILDVRKNGLQLGSCGVCFRRASRQFPNGRLCTPCTSFYEYYKQRQRDMVCHSDNNCIITRDSIKNCRSCRWNRCLAIVTNQLADSSEQNNVSEECFGKFIESTEYVSDSQPTINLTPLKMRSKSKGQKSKDKLCKVCGDRARGFNHGVFSCNGCGIFFKRVFKKERKIGQCVQNDDGCQINETTRNKCRFCRYQACLRAGMTVVGQTDNSQLVEQEEEATQEESKEVAEEETAEEETAEEEPEVVRDNRSDVSVTTGFDYASIHCGRSPETPLKGNESKRPKN